MHAITRDWPTILGGGATMLGRDLRDSLTQSENPDSAIQSCILDSFLSSRQAVADSLAKDFPEMATVAELINANNNHQGEYDGHPIINELNLLNDRFMADPSKFDIYTTNQHFLVMLAAYEAYMVFMTANLDDPHDSKVRDFAFEKIEAAHSSNL